jgi:uncharacterized metal-binding protein
MPDSSLVEEEMENASSAAAPKVIVYTCSGASNLGQLANDIAVRLDRLGLAELVCLAEVGAGEGDSETQTTPRQVLAISGCANGCCASMLERHGVEASRTVTLAERGIAKAKHVLVDEGESERVFGQVLAELAPFLHAEDR